MDVHLHYAGQTWRLAEGADRGETQLLVKGLCAEGGGIAEFNLADGAVLAAVVGPQIPLAIVESGSAVVRSM